MILNSLPLDAERFEDQALLNMYGLISLICPTIILYRQKRAYIICLFIHMYLLLMISTLL